jgi:hypothetical protein
MSTIMEDHFNGKLETRSKPCLVTTLEQLDRANHYQ